MVTNVDESGDKDLRQDINSKHQIVIEVINETSADNLKAPTTESQSKTNITKNMIDKIISKVKSKRNKIFQDLQAKLVNPIYNSVIEGLVVTHTLTRSIVENSDELKGNIALLVKEDKESETNIRE